MNLEDATDALKKLRREQSRGTKFAHQPVTLIWAAQRAARSEPRVARWRDVLESISGVISALGGSLESDVAANQVIRLQQSVLIDFQYNEAPSGDGDPTRWLEQENPLLGLTYDAYELFTDRDNFDEFARLAVKPLGVQQSRIILDYFNVFAGFGEVPGVSVGEEFPDRAALAKRRVHTNIQWGIVGTPDRGAESIVVSGGYEDDKDYGDHVIYTGHGGRDGDSGKQIDHQTFEARGNAALITSHVTGAPVRLIRGFDPKKKSRYAPKVGYRYDGLFRVARFWQETGVSGYRVCSYMLVQVSDSVESENIPSGATSLPPGTAEPGRRTVTRDQINRTRALSLAIKELHDYSCQICDIRLTIKGRGYAQGAHIRPLGRPHDGTDTPDNLLCLCPNCHVLFDSGEIVVNHDLSIVSPYPNRGSLRVSANHVINVDNIDYHRELFLNA